MIRAILSARANLFLFQLIWVFAFELSQGKTSLLFADSHWTQMALFCHGSD